MLLDLLLPFLGLPPFSLQLRIGLLIQFQKFLVLVHQLLILEFELHDIFAIFALQLECMRLYFMLYVCIGWILLIPSVLLGLFVGGWFYLYLLYELCSRLFYYWLIGLLSFGFRFDYLIIRLLINLNNLFNVFNMFNVLDRLLVGMGLKGWLVGLFLYFNFNFNWHLLLSRLYDNLLDLIVDVYLFSHFLNLGLNFLPPDFLFLLFLTDLLRLYLYYLQDRHMHCRNRLTFYSLYLIYAILSLLFLFDCFKFGSLLNLLLIFSPTFFFTIFIVIIRLLTFFFVSLICWVRT